ncbi:MAG: response regulator [Eubacteriales bacterium]
MFRVVIADDERIIRAGLKQLKWEEHGMTIVAEAKNGIEAAEIIDAMEFDLLITDIRMPGMTGIELAKTLRKTNPKTKIIMLSGYSEFQYAQDALNMGVTEYILKPSTPKNILNAAIHACELIEKENNQVKKVENLEKQLEEYQGLVGTKEVVKEENGTDIKNILQYIYENYHQPLNLSTLAEEFHFSTVYLSYYIKRYTNHTFLEILTSIRMYHAAKLLIGSNLKNGKIGQKVGVPDERYFGQVFKKTYHTTPYEYRKSNVKPQISLKELIQNIEVEQ